MLGTSSALFVSWVAYIFGNEDSSLKSDYCGVVLSEKERLAEDVTCHPDSRAPDRVNKLSPPEQPCLSICLVGFVGFSPSPSDVSETSWKQTVRYALKKKLWDYLGIFPKWRPHPYLIIVSHANHGVRVKIFKWGEFFHIERERALV